MLDHSCSRALSLSTHTPTRARTRDQKRKRAGLFNPSTCYLHMEENIYSNMLFSRLLALSTNMNQKVKLNFHDQTGKLQVSFSS